MDGNDAACDASDNSGATCASGSTKYDGSSKPDVTATTAKFSAIACANIGGGNANSAVVNKAFTATAQAVSASPNGGAITADTEVTLASVVSSSICYTLDGNGPVCAADAATCTTGDKYDASSKPSVTKTESIKAIGCGNTGASGTNSAIATVAFTATAQAVSATPNGGTITADTAVTLASVVSSGICYTLDGTTPACAADGVSCTAGTIYDASSKPSVTKTETIKAEGCGNTGASGSNSAAVAAVAFTWTAANPTFNPAASNVAADSAVTLTSAGSANICYTWTGTDPACNADGTCATGTAYNATAKPTVSATSTLEAIGCGGTGKSNSAVASAAYTVNVTTTTAAPASTTISGASTGAVWSAIATLLALMGVSAML